ncbi:MAG: ABC transporter ATP-binding protein [Elusimicrobia bacterium]|nr:ABC transporter ATP-binding protein [Elusimicrobiota bacterium]
MGNHSPPSKDRDRPSPPEGLLELKGIKKSFGGAPILRGISLSVRKGEFLTFLGPSGCGKTTTLRIIAGFERPDAGEIILSGEEVSALPPYRRDVHTVFQHYALFPHYSVYENIAFGLRIKNLAEDDIRRRCSEALALVKLSGFEKRRTTELSGGQMQRIALARALVGRPSLLLLDEPLGALDLKLRKEMQLELKSLQRKLGLAFVYVTHDQEEAMTISDRIAVFNQGLVEQVGTPREIYERPLTSFAADFIGSANVMSAEILSSCQASLRLRLEGELDLNLPCLGPSPAPAGAGVKIALRPERITIHYQDDVPLAFDRIRIKGLLREKVYLGSASQIFFSPFSVSGKSLLALSMETRHHQKHEPGSPVWADVSAADFLLLDA